MRVPPSDVRVSPTRNNEFDTGISLGSEKPVPRTRLRHTYAGHLPSRASTLRFRAVLLTSVTTIVGLVLLLLESSPQAQILVPLTTSIVFGLTVSTRLVLFMVPALHAIIEDMRTIPEHVGERSGAPEGSPRD